MSSMKGRVCLLCGKPCYGRTCHECFCKGKYKSLGRKSARRRRYVKQIQHHDD